MAKVCARPNGVWAMSDCDPVVMCQNCARTPGQCLRLLSKISNIQNVRSDTDCQTHSRSPCEGCNRSWSSQAWSKTSDILPFSATGILAKVMYSVANQLKAPPQLTALAKRLDLVHKQKANLRIDLDMLRLFLGHQSVQDLGTEINIGFSGISTFLPDLSEIVFRPMDPSFKNTHLSQIQNKFASRQPLDLPPPSSRTVNGLNNAYRSYKKWARTQNPQSHLPRQWRLRTWWIPLRSWPVSIGRQM